MTNKSPSDDASTFIDALKPLLDKAKANQVRTETQYPADYATLCLTWARHDFWSLKTGLNLLCQCHPEKELWDFGILDLWTLAKTCIGPGGSLAVTDITPKGMTDYHKAINYRTRPRDLLRWAREKNIPIPAELDLAVNPSRQSLQTQPATLNREDAKAKRLRLLRGFCESVYQRGVQQGMEWAQRKEPYPVTKAEFREVFYKLHGEQLGRKISQATFYDDLAFVNAAFAPGIKSSVNNVLTQLFGVNLSAAPNN